MSWKPDRGRPLCPQICEQFCVRIARGELAPHQKVPSVRDTAADIGVNPNTVQHAFNELEQQGVLYSVQGTGWFVSENTSVAEIVLKRLAETKTAAFFADMENLGLDADAVKSYVKEWAI